ncbi:MAG: polymerase, partial [Actinomycetota bacterium]|nr:polymerase [Actinomycetota bacterium]
MLPTLAGMAIVLLATWMGARNGGYFVEDWALATFALAGVALVMAAVGRFGGAQSWQAIAATGLFAAFTVWTFASVLWSPNRGEAWIGAGQTLLYLLAFWVPLSLLTSGASRRWILVASALGPAGVSLFTLMTITSRVDDLFVNNRFFGSVGYYNGEAAFVLVPFWVSIYLGGSRRVHPILRGLALGGAVLGVGIAVLTQSRGAMVAMGASLPFFFAFSGQRLRGLLALAPVVVALLLSFDELNGVYRAFVAGDSAETALSLALPILWRSATAAAVYGLLWGVIDGFW